MSTTKFKYSNNGRVCKDSHFLAVPAPRAGVGGGMLLNASTRLFADVEDGDAEGVAGDRSGNETLIVALFAALIDGLAVSGLELVADFGKLLFSALEVDCV